MAEFGIKESGHLGGGSVATAEGDLYRVSMTKTAVVESIKVLNTNAATQTIDLFLEVSGTSRHLRRMELLQFESGDFLADEPPIEIGADSAIRALTTTTTAVNFAVMGAEVKV